MKALEEMDANYNRQCEALEILQEQKRVYVIAPSQPVTVGRLEPDLEKLGSLYWMGIMTPDGRFRTSAAICSRMEVFESCMKKTCIQ